MKTWAFVEGDCEATLVKNYVYRSNHPIELVYDESRFIDDPCGNNENWIYIDDCGSIDRVPHQINDIYYRIEKSGSNQILVVGDVERRIKCPSVRIQTISEKLDTEVDQSNLIYVLSVPKIEEVYWDHREIIASILDLEIQKVPPKPNKRFEHELKGLFKSKGKKYKKTIFANDFCGRLEYGTSPNDTVKRLNRAIRRYCGL